MAKGGALTFLGLKGGGLNMFTQFVICIMPPLLAFVNGPLNVLFNEFSFKSSDVLWNLATNEIPVDNCFIP